MNIEILVHEKTGCMVGGKLVTKYDYVNTEMPFT